MSEVDLKALGAYQQRVWGYRQGEMVALMMHLGDRLGLYRAMAGGGAMTATDLADKTGLHSRWVLEWLRSQAAANLVDSEDGQSFVLPAEGALVVADPSALTFAGSAMSGPRPPATIDKVAEAFRTGLGMTYDDHGEGEAVCVEKSFGNWIEHVLVPQFVPAVPGLKERLEQGATVADVGCGAGLSLRLLTEAYPQVNCHGFDISEHAIELARQRSAEANLEIGFHAAGAEVMAQHGPYDLVLTFDCLHDMTRPDLAAAEVRSTIADDGVWLIKEIRSTSDFNANRKNPMLAMMYATSVMVCMSSSMSTEDGLGYGTLGLNPDALEELVTAAGFSSLSIHEFDDPVNMYYEVRP